MDPASDQRGLDIPMKDFVKKDNIHIESLR